MIPDLELCERGNTLLVNDDGAMIAWLDLPGEDKGSRLEVAYTPENYPCLRVTTVMLDDRLLAEHIESRLVGWTVMKLNLGLSEPLRLDKYHKVVDSEGGRRRRAIQESKPQEKTGENHDRE